MADCSDLQAHLTKNRMVFVKTAPAPTFAKATGTAAGPSLSFGAAYMAVEVQDTRVGLIPISADGAPRLWVEKNALLCSLSPVKHPNSQLEKRLYIRTPPQRIDDQATTQKPLTVLASHNPARTCTAPSASCQEINRFSRMFIYDEAVDAAGQKSFLISFSPLLGENATLIGWIPADSGYIWSTAFAVHPSSDNENDFICAYTTPEAARQAAPPTNMPNEPCWKLLAGEARWITDLEPLPLLESPQKGDNSVLHVASEANQDKRRISASSSDVPEIGLNGADVVFVIDGTNSMGEHIRRAAGEFIPAITNAVINNPEHGGIPLRFGYVIYRDKRLGEGKDKGKSLVYGLPEACTTSNGKEFMEKLATVEVTRNDDDDYWEDTVDGMSLALEAFDSGCEKHVKIMIVIGDAGLKPLPVRKNERQQDRHIDEMRMKPVLDKIELLQKRTPILPFFIRTPKLSTAGMKNPEEYLAAYDHFERDAQYIVKFMIEQARKYSENIAPQNGLERVYTLPPEKEMKATDSIVQRIAQSTVTEVMGGLRQKVVAGTTPIDALRSLKQRGIAVPMYHLEFVNISTCESYIKSSPELRERAKIESPATLCAEGREVQVRDFYIKRKTTLYRIEDNAIKVIDRSHPIAVKVYVAWANLVSWTISLKKVEDKVVGARTLQEKTDKLGEALIGLIQKILGGNPAYDEVKETPLEYTLRVLSFPVSLDSSLLNYRMEELSKLNRSEFYALLDWIRRSRELLEIILSSHNPNGFRLDTYKDSDMRHHVRRVNCVGAGPGDCTGNWGILAEAFPPDAGFCKRRGRESSNHYCWIPSEYLP